MESLRTGYGLPEQASFPNRFPLAVVVAAAVWAIGFSFSDGAEPKGATEGGGYQDGWQQAGSGSERLGQQLRSHRVRLERDGQLTGQVFAWSPTMNECCPAQKASVNLVQFGKIVHRVMLEQNGQFLVEGVKPGVYAVVVAGVDGFLADTAHVVGGASSEVGDARKISAVIRPVWFQLEKARLDIDSLAVPPTSFPVLKRLVTSYVPRESAVLVSLVEPPDAASPAALPQEKPIAEDPALRDAVPGTTVYPASTIQQHAVHLLPDGRLLGRARRLHRESGRPLRIHRTTVFMIRDNDVVAASPIDELGVFSFEGLKPGMHSLVATGPEGFAAFAVLVEPPMQGKVSRSSLLRNGNKFHLVAAQQSPDLALDMALLDPENFAALWDILARELGWLPPGGLPGAGGPSGALTGGNVGPPNPGLLPTDAGGVVGGGIGGGLDAMTGFGGIAGGGGGGGVARAANGAEEPLASPFGP